MKQLTYSKMAAARLRANKRQYMSLFLGVFLSVFLVTVLIMGIYGVYLSYLQKRYDRIGYLDMVMTEEADLSEADLQSLGIFDQIGHIRLTGQVGDLDLYVGSYDDVGISLMNLVPVEGRLPEFPGEIAMESSAMGIMGAYYELGDTVTLSVTPIDGSPETRSFTLVGILPERVEALNGHDLVRVTHFPPLVTVSQEPPFVQGRVKPQWVMTLKSSVSLNEALKVIYRDADSDGPGFYLSGHRYSYIYGLDSTGNQVQYPKSPFSLGQANREFIYLAFGLCALASTLLLSCGMGISGAMEGLLSRRREEIGVLRATGATRRQIRRMFGRENLLLAFLSAPISIGFGCLTVRILSRFLPSALVYGFRLWLLLPIALFSIIVILLSGYLPLARAAKLMPMSVIRDTAMLRRGKRIRSKKQFSPPGSLPPGRSGSVCPGRWAPHCWWD